jgi:predicted MFS family arabinose efflux permease
LPIDWAGAAAFIVASVSLLMALPASSKDGPVDTLRLPLLALAIVAGSIFFAIERRAAAPIIAFAIFRRPIFSLAVAVTFLYGASLHSMGVFVPLLLQGVLGQTPTRSGLVFLPMVLALVVGSIVGGQLVTRLGKYRWTATTGLVMAAVGTYALSRVDAGFSPNALMPRLGLIGFGIGIALPALSLAAQNAVAQRDVGACSSLMQFSRMLGGSIGVAILGALLSSSLHQGLVSALSRVLFTAAIILFVAVAISVLIADVPLRQTVDDEKDDSV